MTRMPIAVVRGSHLNQHAISNTTFSIDCVMFPNGDRKLIIVVLELGRLKTIIVFSPDVARRVSFNLSLVKERFTMSP